jgi:hypothetical protein
MKGKILKLLNNVGRERMQQLINYLEKTDYFTAPASTRYHDSCEGGLAKHSLEVYENLVKINTDYNLGIKEESLILCGLLHDICKVNFYKTDTRNVKVDGTWTQVPYYTVEDKFPFGHGEKSVYIINEFIQLDVGEAMAIRWHMGAYNEKYFDTLSGAMEKYKIILALQMADLQSTYWSDK